MTSWILRGVGAALIALTATAGMAQQSTNRVASSTDWSVFVEESPRECWGVSSPKQVRNTRNGQPVEVRRGDILLFVTFRPGAGSRGEVSFTGGYPFADGSNVEMRIGSDAFQLFTDGDWAWPANADDDARILAAMRRGSEAVLTARSARGTQTQDTFSLMGFTAAMTEAENRCAG
ncbi:invasion associated locus B family protein [Plastorhodobacter daqingensis]|uniref:Invasion associated locus B family protein n=1 Tax=Plastorhodobacter daqingensis TaxID=1387281 RepID=A0ABW2UFE1_9RHOB